MALAFHEHSTCFYRRAEETEPGRCCGGRGSTEEQKKRARQGPSQGVGSRPPRERSPGTGAAPWA